MKIALFGCKGVGKTTVGKKLAETLNLPHVDTDQFIVKQHGEKISIQEIFQNVGEKAFRNLEYSVIQEIIPLNDCVVSLGGGAPIDPHTRTLLNHFHLIHLTASPDYLWERVRSTQTSYLDKPLNQASFISIYEKRIPLYRSLAQEEINIEGKSPHEIASEVAML